MWDTERWRGGTKDGADEEQIYDRSYVPTSIVPETKVSTLRFNIPHPDPSHLPTGPPGHLAADVEKRETVKEAFKWSWDAYEKHAFGADEVRSSGLPLATSRGTLALMQNQFHPLSQGGSNLSAAGGIGYTIVDSLDTLLIMDLLDEYTRARDWCRDRLSFEKEAEFNTFEVRSSFPSEQSR